MAPVLVPRPGYHSGTVPPHSNEAPAFPQSAPAEEQDTSAETLMVVDRSEESATGAVDLGRPEAPSAAVVHHEDVNMNGEV